MLSLAQIASLTLRAQQDHEAHAQLLAAAATQYATDVAALRASLAQQHTQALEAQLAAQQTAHAQALASLQATHAAETSAAESKLVALTATYEAQIATWRASAQVRHTQRRKINLHCANAIRM